jgi:hypothetical protein
MKIIVSILVFVLCIAVVLLTYWLGGGNFVRNGDLGATFLFANVLGFLLSGFVFSNWERLR